MAGPITFCANCRGIRQANPPIGWARHLATRDGASVHTHFGADLECHRSRFDNPEVEKTDG
jgi:hypothetical protein